MKTSLKVLFGIIIYSFSVLVAYNFGYSDNKKEEYEIQNAIADRYFKHIGNPSTQLDHCKFIQVVYGDYSECELITSPTISNDFNITHIESANEMIPSEFIDDYYIVMENKYTVKKMRFQINDNQLIEVDSYPITNDNE